MLALASALDNTQLEDAFAAVPRESFLGKGPWRIMTPWSPYATVPEQDPALLYQDVVVALDEARGVNNGSPSLHANWMHLLAPRRGERVAHIGAGAGYYSAILAELVGREGSVTAIEFDAQRAQSAKQNLKNRSNVYVITADGRHWPQQPADVIYVNFATPRLAEAWIDNLAMGGRLLLPLGVPRESPTGGWRGLNAVAVLVTRLDQGFAARVLVRSPSSSPRAKAARRWTTRWIACRPALTRAAGKRSVASSGISAVDDAKCWFKGDGWALSYEEPAA